MIFSSPHVQQKKKHSKKWEREKKTHKQTTTSDARRKDMTWKNGIFHKNRKYILQNVCTRESSTRYSILKHTAAALVQQTTLFSQYSCCAVSISYAWSMASDTSNQNWQRTDCVSRGGRTGNLTGMSFCSENFPEQFSVNQFSGHFSGRIFSASPTAGSYTRRAVRSGMDSKNAAGMLWRFVGVRTDAQAHTLSEKLKHALGTQNVRAELIPMVEYTVAEMPAPDSSARTHTYTHAKPW